MDAYILDTNLFFNMEPGLGIGSNTKEVLDKLTRAARVLKEKKRGTFAMPVRIVDEFLGFFTEGNDAEAQTFLHEVITKSPDITSVSFEASVFYRLIDDVRLRNLRGLTIAEDEVQKAARTMSGTQELTRKDFQIQSGVVVKSLRERYRHATREGFLDSVADLDMIVLAKEMGGYVVSTDSGLLTWGRYFGVKEMRAPVFGSLVEGLLR